MSIPPSGYPAHIASRRNGRGANGSSGLGRRLSLRWAGQLSRRSAKLIAAGILIGAVVTQAACGDDGSVCQPTADRPDCEAYFSLMPAVAITLPQRSVSALT